VHLFDAVNGDRVADGERVVVVQQPGREVRDVQHVRTCNDHGPFDEVAKLSDVARP
jgi:hypothetical protein